MNLLVDEFPEAVEVGGKVYEIASDFRTCLRIILAMEDSELASVEKTTVMLRLFYKDNIPSNIEEAIKQATKFLNGGVEVEPGEEEEIGPRVYSLQKDSGYIFSAFRQTHGIDLSKEDMHWWQWLALFMDLGSETTFCSLVGLRKRVKNGDASPEERKQAREMGKVFEVPETNDLTLEEMEMERVFNQSLKGSV
jgi:hypothetical protein